MSSMVEVIGDPAVETAMEALQAAAAQVAAVRTDALSNSARLSMLRRLEVVARALPAVGLELVAQMAEQWSNAEFATNNLVDTLAEGLRITPAEARARWRAADDLAHRTDLAGQVLEPRLVATAAAQAEGAIGAAHVRVVREVLAHLPAAVDAETWCEAEAFLAGYARELRPDQLRQVATKLEALINPDGTFTDSDRARRRGFTLGRQGPDLMSRCTMWADPELRAYLEATFAKYAKPGMCNPEDDAPVVDAEPDEAARERDSRTAGQRQHDALKTVLRDSIASGRLGQHRGLPVTVIVSMTLQELESAVAEHDSAAPDVEVVGMPVTTGGGTLLPMRTALRLASHAHHYLALFDRDTGRPLYLGRSKRIASADQRIVLHARDIGCTFPGCAKPGYLCQTHHRTEWADGGATDADQLTFACEPHHRLAGTTAKDWKAHAAAAGHRHAGRTEWIPPAHVDPRRRPRLNRYHHPSDYLARPPGSATEGPNLAPG
ncbi:HNH endonuclease signature motif containing protein [Nocardia blacklockiae]|uniref:HNH endonuclease signature motif containing protein n=1 Tax=Nocardia blacklockiae TaxID=480036 RepID=UPI001895D14E|nr:HNH endonuclease signature motif containing protein [Nocardia blacklockiae]MBF6170726.1 HNH endonuclease [Nocardia blacklockiae]